MLCIYNKRVWLNAGVRVNLYRMLLHKRVFLCGEGIGDRTSRFNLVSKSISRLWLIYPDVAKNSNRVWRYITSGLMKEHYRVSTNYYTILYFSMLAPAFNPLSSSASSRQPVVFCRVLPSKKVYRLFPSLQLFRISPCSYANYESFSYSFCSLQAKWPSEGLNIPCS